MRKKLLLLTLIGISLFSCKKEESEEDASPKQSIGQKQLMNNSAFDWYPPWSPSLDSYERIKIEPGYFFPIPSPIFDPIENQKEITTTHPTGLIINSI